jgi:D-glycero-D-manno-heptose 1,7-bisphosphate phosphatase
MSIKAAFLDRDGVINRKAPEPGYVTRWEDVHFLPDVAQAISVLKGLGFLVIVVSNQRCVAKGLITETELEALHRKMSAYLEDHGATIDAVYYCPHENHPPCSCRKPQPGMLLEAAREHDIDLSSSWMIGDSERDVEAGKSAGCRTVRLRTAADTAVGDADLMASSLLDATSQIVRWEQSPPAGPVWQAVEPLAS